LWTSTAAQQRKVTGPSAAEPETWSPAAVFVGNTEESAVERTLHRLAFQQGVFVYSHIRSSAGVALLRTTNEHAVSLASAKEQVPK